jgi:hypothetical protein
MVKKLLTIVMVVMFGYLFYKLYKVEQKMVEVDKLMLELKCVKSEKNIKKIW